MLCCIGLVAGITVGQYFGGPWIFIAPAIGFGLGLVGDVKFMSSHFGFQKKSKGDKKCH